MTVDHRYIDSLPPDARPVALIWANMDSDEFQARIGPHVDALNQKVDVLDTKIDSAKNELLGELRRTRNLPVSRKALAMVAVFGGASAEVLLQAISAVAHGIGAGVRP